MKTRLYQIDLQPTIVADWLRTLHSASVKLSHKIAKLGRAESYKRGWRRVRRKFQPIPVAPLLASLDQSRVRQIQEKYASSPVQIAKYADVERYMKLNVERVQDLGLNRSPPQDILDLGCGGGFVL